MEKSTNKPTTQQTATPVIEPSIEQNAKKPKKPLNTKFVIIAAIALAVLVRGGIALMTMSKTIEVPNMLLYVGEAAEPEYTIEGLSKEDIDSIEYKLDNEDFVTVTEDNKLLAENTGEAFLCKMTIKSGLKRWKGEFYINTSYKAVDFKNGNQPLKASGSCPLKITNPEIGEKMYVYFKNTGSGKDFSIMVEPEKTASTKVAAGTYTMYVAFGYTTQEWYGTKYLFGVDGNSYYVRDETLSFTASSRAYSGFTMTLPSSEGGNVGLRSITYSEFPK